MKQILKLIDGKQIKCRPQPHLTDNAPIDMMFELIPVSVYQRTKNTLTYIFINPKCVDCVFIADVTPHIGKWNWYSTLIINATPILQSSL
jgi:hypothetical protein